MATPTVGEAIGLSDKPNLYANVLNSTLARQDAKEARDAENRRKAQEKEDAAAQKAVSAADVYLDPAKWHRMYSGAATKEIVDFKNDFINYKNENPNSWQTYAAQKFDELKGRLAELSTNSNNAKELEKAAVDQKAHIPDEVIQSINKTDFSKGLYRDPETGKVVSPEWGNISKGVDDRYGILLDKSGNLNLNLVPKTDYNKQIELFTNNDHNWTDTGTSVSRVKNTPNRYEQRISQEINPIASETFVNQVTTNPAYVKDWMLSNKEKIDKEIPSELRSNPKEYSQAVRDLMAQEVRTATTLNRSKVSGYNYQPREPKEVKEKVNLDATFDELLPTMQEKEQIFIDTPYTNRTKKEINSLYDEAATLRAAKDEEGAAKLEKEAKLKEDKLKSTVPLAEIEYKRPVTLKTQGSYTTINNGEGVINLTDNTQYTGPNQVDFIPKHIGILTRNGKKKAYVFGSIKDKEESYNKDGSVKSDVNVSAELAIPLDKAEKFLNEQGNPTKWTSEAIKRAEGKKAETPTKAESKQKKKIDGF